MTILKRGKITYYVKDESVVVSVGGYQYIAYNVYSLQNRKPFYDFRKTLLKSREDEYGSIIEQIKLGQRFGLKAVAASKPQEAYTDENSIRR